MGGPMFTFFRLNDLQAADRPVVVALQLKAASFIIAWDSNLRRVIAAPKHFRFDDMPPLRL